MELKFTKTEEHGDTQVVVLNELNEVKHGQLNAKGVITAQPYVKQYKQHASALKKFEEIVKAVINDND